MADDLAVAHYRFSAAEFRQGYLVRLWNTLARGDTAWKSIA
jgi:hypothetical protein